MRQEDGPTIRRIVIRVSIRLRTGIDYLLNLSVLELFEIVKEVAEIGKKQRV